MGIWMRHRVRQAGKFAKKSYKNDIKQNAKEQEMLYTILQNQQEQLNLLSQSVSSLLEVLENIQEGVDYLSMGPSEKAEYEKEKEAEYQKKLLDNEPSYVRPKNYSEPLLVTSLPEFTSEEYESNKVILNTVRQTSVAELRSNYVALSPYKFDNEVEMKAYDDYIIWALSSNVRAKYNGIPSFKQYCEYFVLIKPKITV